MVTHGYVVFKYIGIYYTFYNHSDSYIEHLGNVVVNEIIKMIDQNRKQEYKDYLLRIPLNGSNEGDEYVGSFRDMLKYPETYRYFTSNEESYAEYTYIIDFDNNKLTINRYCKNIFVFNLNKIPFDWFDIIENNSNYEDEFDDQEDIKNEIKELEQRLSILKTQLK